MGSSKLRIFLKNWTFRSGTIYRIFDHEGFAGYLGFLDQVLEGYFYDRMVLRYPRPSGNRMVVLELCRLPYVIRWLYSFHPRLKSGIRDSGYDCVIVEEMTHPSAFWAISIKRKPRAKKNAASIHYSSSPAFLRMAAATNAAARVLV